MSAPGCRKCGGDGPRRPGKRTCRQCESDARQERAQRVDVTALTGALQWANSLEREAVEAVARTGSVAAAAEALGMTPRLLRGHLQELERRAARQGWAPGANMTKTVPDGFHAARVSTLYGADGAVRGQWVIAKRDREAQIEALLDAVQRIADPFKGHAEPVPVPEAFDDDLLAVYPMGDPHFGMYAWAAETGEDFDLARAEADLISAVDHLVDSAPRARHAIVASLGDTFHADGKGNTTTAGTPVDVDTRWGKVLAVTIRALRRCIDRALTKHELVEVKVVNGNHDDHSSIMLAHCLALYYEREPRVRVDLSPSAFLWYRFGKVLLGFHHGHTVKRDALPGVMACDRKEDWGATEYRYWYIGHVHHERTTEYPGVTVESFRTLAGKDAWHSRQGYRALQDMRLDVWHREWGLDTRHVVGIRRVRARQAA